eukprot:1540505-Alexandrium_andersonii.AAC.1
MPRHAVDAVVLHDAHEVLLVLLQGPGSDVHTLQLRELLLDVPAQAVALALPLGFLEQAPTHLAGLHADLDVPNNLAQVLGLLQGLG